MQTFSTTTYSMPFARVGVGRVMLPWGTVAKPSQYDDSVLCRSLLPDQVNLFKWVRWNRRYND